MKDGLFSSDPLYEVLDKELGQNLTQKPAKSMLNLGITNLNNGTFVSFNDKFKNRDLMHALKASLAQPTVFEPYNAWNTSWVAGQSIWELEASAPILRCLSKGFKEEDIVIDAVINKADHVPFMNVSNINSIQMAMRSLNLMDYYTSRQGLSFA